ncbi:MAG: PucR family transcriptional regulator, partial [Propionibacterium sp.]|nr:PucR family transcriptional regulator [Propionibacterium sp.]
MTGGLPPVLSDQRRATITAHLVAHSGELTTRVVEAIQSRHSWFTRLGAEERSWITVVARAGIDNFISWFADDAKADVNPGSLFNAAPRALTRKVSLHQTVDLVRTTVDVVGEQINELVPPQERRALELAIVYFSRDVAFAAAELYARAAELRGGWDERMEALIIDAVVRGEADDMVVSRASALGWHSQGAVMVVVGPSAAGADLESYRHAAEALGLA